MVPAMDAPAGLVTGGPAVGARPASQADAPPAILPGEHFAFALVCLLTGAAGVIWAAPELAAGAFPAPRVVAVTHLWTLGFITTSILGALYQFLPVALGVSIRSERAAHASFGLLALGVPAFAVGLGLGVRPAVHAGASAVALGLGIAAVNLGLTLGRAPTRDVTWWALGGAALSLVVTLALGLTMAVAGPGGLLGVHVHLALCGFVLMVVVAVANHLLPMFLLSHGAPSWPARAAAGAIAAGCASLVLPLFGAGWWAPASLLTAGVVALLLQAALFYRHRVRRPVDAGMQLARAALVALLFAVVLGWAVLSTAATDPRLVTAYGLVAVASLGLFVAGHYYKIVPFLIWFHRYGPRLGRAVVPRVADLTDARLARIAGALLVGGVAIAAAGVVGAAVWAVRLGGATLLAGSALEAGQLALALARRDE